MANSVKDQIELLVELQSIETETGNIEAVLGGVAERFNALDGEIEAYQRGIDDEVSQIGAMQKQYREHDADVQENLARIKRSKEKLHAIKNNKEYLSVLKEIEDMETANSSLEDEMLEYLDRVDGLESSIAAKKDEFVVVGKQIKSDKESIEKETEEGRKRIAELEKSRKEVVGRVESEWLATFRLVKERRGGGLAVVPVTDAVCHGCNVNLPPQLYNELQRFDSLKFCPNCQRIIYWKNSESESPA